jgi:hypothetical protein
VIGIKLTRETRLGITDPQLAAYQALVGQRMMFSRIRLQKGTGPKDVVGRNLNSQGSPKKA